MVVRVHLDIVGVVQGVGFRPAVARIAAEFGLSGWVYNDAGSVQCEFEGTQTDVDAAVSALRDRPPPMARIDSVRVTAVDPCGAVGFAITESRTADDARTLVPPDVAACADCMREMRDPTDRRFGHPFITCTNCGPRYTVITCLPYDRPSTTMAEFPMCEACWTEYHDPHDRRYHAQTIACPDCGPTLSLPVSAAADVIGAGKVLAIKGIGGFHLACRADDDGAVNLLRSRKNRPVKPFALMVTDLAAAREIAEIDHAAAVALTSAAAPIVVVARRERSAPDAGSRSGGLSASVAPGLADLGVMLAYSPVHHLLFDQLGPVPLVMTSANLGGSPIVFRDGDLHSIDGLADAVLTHDRPIGTPCEDSVIAIDTDGHELPVRRSRGYAPLPVTVACDESATGDVILATGGDLKSTFCLLGPDGQAHLSPHLGDMADLRTQLCFESVLDHLAFVTGLNPTVIACDMHPRYATTAWARRNARDRPVVTVQHHHAHAVSLLADNGRLDTPIIAVTYDGTGYGPDGSIWGGELLAIPDPAGFERVGHLAPFALPGGEGAVRRPARIALDLLSRAGIEWGAELPPVAAVGEAGLRVLAQQIPCGVGCVPTTSMGRLFDAVASLLDVCQEVSYEGQAAVQLEHAARGGRPVDLEFAVSGAVMDPAPVVIGLVDGLRAGSDRADLAAGFHQAVIRATSAAARHCAETAGIPAIGLTGGVFANRLLLQGLRESLTMSGYEVLTHRIVPCNDGGLALGQATVAAAVMAQERASACASESPAG